ncbi:uncharacterized protein LOC121878460 [Homarus americanus]|uniref:uncharacterized protein LOC121878460 n=1 Tax=Homarus americanus TaxID=6706 RepID=UPI001C4369D5|nr:uncharacterized protein LOC121878460 [Homarus americanus]
MKTMNNKTKAVEIVKCFFIPEYHVLLALYRHIESTVSGSVSVNAVEWAAFTRLLQAMVEAIPQAIIQSYFFFVDFMPKDTEFASSIPVASMCLSMFNAAFGYTFFVVYKYYDQMREYPPFWQCLLVALASLFILGGRTISVSLMGYAYMPWLAFLCLVIIYLLLFVSWTYRVWKRDGDPQKNIMIRAAYSIIETFAVTVSLKKMVLTSLCFMGLCVAYVIQNNNELVMWIMFCVPIVVQILGLILVLPCRYIYEQAYKVLVLSILPSKQVIDEDIEN